MGHVHGFRYLKTKHLFIVSAKQCQNPGRFFTHVEHIIFIRLKLFIELIFKKKHAFDLLSSASRYQYSFEHFSSTPLHTHHKGPSVSVQSVHFLIMLLTPYLRHKPLSWHIPKKLILNSLHTRLLWVESLDSHQVNALPWEISTPFALFWPSLFCCIFLSLQCTR